MLLFSLEVGVLALTGLHVVLGDHETAHLVLIELLLLLVVLGWLARDFTAVVVRDLQLTYHFLFGLVLSLKFIVLLFICTDSEEQLCIGLFLCHEFLNDLTNI